MDHIKIGAVSLGCSKNTVDTEILLGSLAEYGFEAVPDPAEAELIIVNTCGFITSAKQDSIDTILEMAEYKRTGRCRALIVTGCLSQRYPEELKAELPEVDMFWGVKDYPALAAELAKRYRDNADNADKAYGTGCGPCCAGRLLTTPPYRAYLRIADGCDNRCSYCAIPLIRGGRRSVPMDALLKEAEALADNGVTELTVIAQDTSAYGLDLYGEPKLKELLLGLARIEKLHWIRLLYAYPNTVTEKLVDAMRDEPKICNYMDIPIQHISPKLLKAMNRHGSAEHIRHIVDHIRRNAPDFILRTTVMLGFPGETDEDHNELMDFLREHPFDRLGAFAFSCEDGTPAAEMPDKVPAAAAQARLDAVMRMQRDISLSLNKKRVGTAVEALVERVSNGTAYCRSYAEAADVDGLIKAGLTGGSAAEIRPGQYVRLRITAAGHYDLIGEIL